VLRLFLRDLSSACPWRQGFERGFDGLVDRNDKNEF
jgi:hypothetical protein